MPSPPTTSVFAEQPENLVYAESSVLSAPSEMRSSTYVENPRGAKSAHENPLMRFKRQLSLSWNRFGK